MNSVFIPSQMIAVCVLVGILCATANKGDWSLPKAISIYLTWVVSMLLVGQIEWTFLNWVEGKPLW